MLSNPQLELRLHYPHWGTRHIADKTLAEIIAEVRKRTPSTATTAIQILYPCPDVYCNLGWRTAIGWVYSLQQPP